jgi:O-antigen/teichoic acid export membrane protein
LTAARPRLRHNLLATYSSQAYVALAGIAFVPVYLRLLGAEAYGLVGFFTVLQASFALLDLGLTRTISRETARFHAHPEDDPLPYRRLFRALQVLFAAIAAVGAILLVSLAGPIAEHWLRNDSLPTAHVRLALQLMGLTVALRWMGGLYRGVVIGAEKLVWTASFNAILATARYIGVIGAMLSLGATTTVFFSYMLALGLAEVAGLVWMAYRHIPRLPAGAGLGFSVRAMRPLLGFSTTIAVTTSLWFLVTQTDKLLLSRLLALRDYGHFTIGVVVAGAVLLATRPLSVPLLPRMARLEATGDQGALRRLYRTATQLTCILAFALSLTLAGFAHEVLWAWTGDAQVTRTAAPIVALYAIGNALLTVGAFPFYLQYATGDLRLHLLGSILFVAVLVPALVLATSSSGAVGAGWVWVGLTALYLVAWVPLVHRRLLTGLHLRWLLGDVAPIVAAAAAMAFAASTLAPETDSRLASLAVAGAAGLAVLAAAVAASSVARERLGGVLRRRRAGGAAA